MKKLAQKDKTIIVLAVLFVLFGIFFGVKDTQTFMVTGFTYTEEEETKTQLSGREWLQVDNRLIIVEVVDSRFSRARGLSGRSGLGKDEGMFFVFDESALHGIWMKDMHFDIDIIWFDEELRIVGIQENATPASFPEVFYPQAPARYVLEVPAGFVGESALEMGSTVFFR